MINLNRFIMISNYSLFKYCNVLQADRFSKCDTCCAITKDLLSLRGQERSATEQRRREHREFVRSVTKQILFHGIIEINLNELILISFIGRKETAT